ncbi:MAG: NAD(P)/FAD-dependent oxidoreductase [Paracoccaceae bacterium]
MNTATDVLVIGAGMAGCGAAARLSAGGAKVTVLEMEDRPAYHTTGRSAAVFILNYGNSVIRALNAASEQTFRAGGAIADHGFLSPRGVLEVEEPGMADKFAEYLDGAKGLEILDAAQTRELMPIYRRDRVVRSAYEPDASDIDVDALLQAYIRGLRAGGGEIVPKAKVTGLSRVGDVWRAETCVGTFEAPVVVNASGAWGDRVAALAEIAPVGLSPCRRTIAVIPLPDGMDPRRWPVTASAAETWYCKPDGMKLWVSPADEDPMEPHDVYPDDMVLAEGLHRFEEATTVEVRRVERSWSGLRTFAPDRTPVNGFEPGVDGFYWLVGQGGYGIQTAPAMSQLAADQILGQKPCVPADTVSALAPSRFR